MSAETLDALILSCRVRRREYARERYAHAADWHKRTRAWEAGTGGLVRGLKMSATYQLKAATRALDAELNESLTHE